MTTSKTFPYVTLRTYHTISDEELERCDFNDLLELDRRFWMNTKAEANKDVDLGLYLSVEREELMNSLTSEEFIEIALDSVDHEDRGALMAGFIQTCALHFNLIDKYERSLLDGKYDNKPEEKLLMDQGLKDDVESLLKCGTLLPKGKFPFVSEQAFIEATDGLYKNHKQWRDGHAYHQHVPHHFPAA